MKPWTWEEILERHTDRQPWVEAEQAGYSQSQIRRRIAVVAYNLGYRAALEDARGEGRLTDD